MFLLFIWLLLFISNGFCMDTTTSTKDNTQLPYLLFCEQPLFIVQNSFIKSISPLTFAQFKDCPSMLPTYLEVCRRLNYKLMAELINGENVNKEWHFSSGFCTTPLREVICSFDEKNLNNTIACFQLLLSKGCNVNQQNKFGNTVLHFVQDIGAMELLLENRANPNIQDNEGKAALHYASLYSPHTSTLPKQKLLIKYGAEPMLCDKYGNKALKQNNQKKLTINIK